MLESLKIVGLCTLAAIAYGIAHDMVTAHVCVEYFSIGHKNIFDPDTGPPYAYALYWGVVATWWLGFPCGLALAFVSRVGPRPKLTARQVAPSLAIGLGLLWVLAMLLLVVNLYMGRRGYIGLFARRDYLGKVEDQFMAVYLTHVFAYRAAPVFAFVLAILLWRKRGRLAISQSKLELDKQATVRDGNPGPFNT